MGAVCLQSRCIEQHPADFATETEDLDHITPSVCHENDKTSPRKALEVGPEPPEVSSPSSRKAPSSPSSARDRLNGIPWETPARRQVPIMLHVYDVGQNNGLSVLNKFLKPLGSGAFHCGVEIMGAEWSYTDIAEPAKRRGTGVFQCRPQNCPGHVYSESVSMGKAFTSEEELYKLIALLAYEWPVLSYDTFTHNCCHFVNEFCQRIGVGAIPPWITHLAGVGASAEDVADTTCCRMMHSQCQAQASLFCGGEGERREAKELCCGEVHAMPALTGGPEYLDWKKGNKAGRWMVSDGSDEVPWRPYRLHRHGVSRGVEAFGVEPRGEVVSLDNLKKRSR